MKDLVYARSTCPSVLLDVIWPAPAPQTAKKSPVKMEGEVSAELEAVEVLEEKFDPLAPRLQDCAVDDAECGQCLLKTSVAEIFTPLISEGARRSTDLRALVDATLERCSSMDTSCEGGRVSYLVAVEPQHLQSAASGFCDDSWTKCLSAIASCNQQY